MLTWQQFIAQLPEGTLQELAQTARDFYQEQRLTTTSLQYLGLAPERAAEPLLLSPSAGAVFANLLQDTTASDTYAGYLTRFSEADQPLAQLFTTLLQERGVPIAEFQAGLQPALDSGAPRPYLGKVAGPQVWTGIAELLQRQGLAFAYLNSPESFAAFLAAQESTDKRAAIAAAFAQLETFDEATTLYSVAQADVPLLQTYLWQGLTSTNVYLLFHLKNLVAEAQWVLSKGYSGTEAQQQLAARFPSQLQAGILALDDDAKGQVALTVEHLATTSVEQLSSEAVTKIQASHPYGRALAAWLQAEAARFISAHPLAADADATTVPARYLSGTLTGQDDVPLAGFQLVVQQKTPQVATYETVAVLRTAPDGRFGFAIRPFFHFGANDAVQLEPTAVRIDVFTPAQTLESEYTLRYEYADLAQDALTLTSDLTDKLAPLASAAITAQAGPLPTELSDYLAAQGLASFADVRNAGGLLRAADIPLDQADVRAAAIKIDALAQLELLSDDFALHGRVIAEGFASPQQIVVKSSRADFVQRLGEDTDAGRLEAAVYYEQAVTVSALTQALGLAAQGRVATGTGPQPDFPPRVLTYEPGEPAPLMTYLSGQQCDCPACRSAVSPTAYLSALLNYATAHLVQPVSQNPRPTVKQLQTLFLQPFCDLPASCYHAETPVCQYRLAIEVLRLHLGNPTLPLATLQPYLDAVYQSLLQGLGTSLAEVKRATTGDKRDQLARRLGLSLSTLNRVRFALANGQPATAEDELEEVFGLASSTRDRLSTGRLRPGGGTATTQLTRWFFQGLRWAVNTDGQGEVHLQVTPPAAGAANGQVLVFKSGDAAARTADDVVATGLLVPTTETPVTYQAVLYPQHDSGLKGSLVVGSGPLTEAFFSIAVVPVVTAGQLAGQEDAWRQADAAARNLLGSGPAQKSWNGYAFLVDPDLLGPDDFRPLPAGQPLPEGLVYRIWLQRYRFLADQTFLPGNAPLPNPDLPLPTNVLDPVLNGLTSYPGTPARTVTYQPVDGGSPVTAAPWQPLGYPDLSGTALLAQLQQDRQSGVRATSDQATQALASLGLTTEAFDRLVGLWQQSQHQALTAAEFGEAQDILRQTLKKTFEAAWYTEEAAGAGPVVLNGYWFQSALHEPQEGVWGPAPADEFGIPAANRPRLDPDDVAPLLLPDAGVGTTAATVWAARKAELQTKQQAILASGAASTAPLTRADALLEYAYRLNPAQANAGGSPPPFPTLEDAWAAYQNDTATGHAAAVTYLTQTLALRPDEAERLLALRAQVLTTPTDSSWQEMAGLLARGWKRAVAYQQSYRRPGTNTLIASWLAQETAAFPGSAADRLVATRKQRLVKWRASAGARTQWVAALGQAFQAAVVDPDQLVPGDFRQAGAAASSNGVPYLNPAYKLYEDRTSTVQSWNVTGAPTWAGVKNVLRADQATLENLAAAATLNVDISAELRQLNLSRPGLDLLIDHLNQGGNRPDELRALLVQVQKTRNSANWSREELAQGIYQSPRFFRAPQTEADPPVVSPWRTSLRERRLWLRALDGRYTQYDALVGAQRQNVKAAEDAFLPLLREALLALNPAGAYPPGNGGTAVPTRQEKLDFLRQKYLIDFQIACCQDTTRVAHAIEVLQNLFVDYRHGLPSPLSGLSLETQWTSFDQDWQWLSSYERWRALMFLYLYPENVLLPALKPQQTAQFRQTIREVRQLAQLRPSDACNYLHAYEAYMGDLSNLTIVASVETSLTAQRQGCAVASTPSRKINLQFGLASGNALYYNLHTLGAQALGASAPFSPDWQPVPNTQLIKRVVGAAVFLNEKQERHVHLFVFLVADLTGFGVAGQAKFARQRFNLETLAWDDDFAELEIPDQTNIDDESVTVAGGTDESWLPIIAGTSDRRDVRLDEEPFFIKRHVIQYSPTNSPYPADTEYDMPSITVKDYFGLSSASASRVFNYDVKNIDLFHVHLDPKGDKLVPLSTKTFFFVNDVRLATSIRTTKEQVQHVLYVKTGYDTNAFRLATFLFDVTATATPRYIIAPESLINGNGLQPSQPSVSVVYPGQSALLNIETPLTSNRYDARRTSAAPGLATIVNMVLFGFNPRALFHYGTPHTDPYPDRTLETNFSISRLSTLAVLSMAYDDGDFPYLAPPILFAAAPSGHSLPPVTVGTVMVAANALADYSRETSTFTLFYKHFSTNDPVTNPVQQLQFILRRATNGVHALFGTAYYEIFAELANDRQPQNAGDNYLYVGPLAPTGLTAAEVLSAPVLVRQVVNADLTSKTTTIADGPVPQVLQMTLPALTVIHPALTPLDLLQRRNTLRTILTPPGGGVPAPSVANLITEGYFTLPLFLALELYRAKYYEESLEYFRLIYDYTKPGTTGATANAQRLIFPGLKTTPSTQQQFNLVMDWLADPNNPYTLAGMRENAQLQYVVVSVVRCLLAYADSEFSRDTAESVPRARTFYELATSLLKQDVLVYDVQDSYAILNQVDVLVPATWMAEWEAVKRLLAAVNQRQVILELLQPQATGSSTVPSNGIIFLFRNPNLTWAAKFAAAWKLINARLFNFQGRYETLCSALGGGAAPLQRTTNSGGLLAPEDQDAVVRALAGAVKVQFQATVDKIQAESTETDNSWLAREVPGTLTTGPDTPTGGNYPPEVILSLSTATTRPFIPFLGTNFCVPTNPVPYSLLLQAELNLYKIRTCRNIAGIQRDLDPYAAPTDNTTGIGGLLGANGQLTRTSRLVVPATQFRYAYIVERARQLVALAQQTEGALLSAFEKRDAEAYSLLKARQDISVSRATVQLQDLRVNEAQDGVELASLQLERSEMMQDQYQQWLAEGVSQTEKDILLAIQIAGIASAAQINFQALGSANSALTTAAAGGLSGATAHIPATLAAIAYFAAAGSGTVAALANSQASTLQYKSTYERREQEWNFQYNLASKDIEIGRQQITLSKDRLRIVNQEKKISELQLDHAETTLNFLTTKFTNAELYDWMSQVLESAYSYFLQQATATARLAELQLAFERQETPAGYIQEDYWAPPTDSAADAAAPDRRGLTGSVRLQQDLTRLDQYAFETTRRKLQLTKTLSLAQTSPVEFARFRETGVLSFAVPQQRFDEDFPGHYLRIIRRVRTSVIALVPTTEGIKARLSTTGTSRVTVAGPPAETLTLPRTPESVSLTSPLNATGLFELEQQASELLFPFEGMGVDAAWTFTLQPAANLNLDFRAIADVLLTIDYTALESSDYAQAVVQSLGTERQQTVAVSLRNRFADQWYDLHHAADLAPADQYLARFRLEAYDLPVNIRDLRLTSLTLYVDVTDENAPTGRSGMEIALGRGANPPTVQGQTNEFGIISTRTGAGLGRIYSGNATALVSLLGDAPAGDWNLAVPAGPLRTLLAQGKVNDLYLLLEVAGDAPAYVAY